MDFVTVTDNFSPSLFIDYLTIQVFDDAQLLHSHVDDAVSEIKRQADLLGVKDFDDGELKRVAYSINTKVT